MFNSSTGRNRFEPGRNYVDIDCNNKCSGRCRVNSQSGCDNRQQPEFRVAVVINIHILHLSKIDLEN